MHSIIMVSVSTGREYQLLPPAGEYLGSSGVWLNGYSSPAWSPDGEWIAFAHEGDIYLIRPDGSNMANLTQTPDVDEDWPAWSPDGERIAFVIRNGESLRDAGWVYMMDRDGSGREQITYGDRTYSRLMWSPDGRWLAATEELGSIDSVYPASSAAVLILIE
jgi:Tol biopolymer transport system component